MTLETISQIRLAPESISGLATAVGNTPLLPLKRLTSHLSPAVQVLAKAEWFNPGGSVKDRPALNILRTAIAVGNLPPGKRLLDSTSGNMGIAYATLGASLGIPITLVIPANASPERIKILGALGAKLILSDALDGTDGAIEIAHRMASEEPDRYFYAQQYDNPANWLAHYHSTGPEIEGQTSGLVTHFVAGLGTTGTLTGTGRYLRNRNPDVELVAVQIPVPRQIRIEVVCWRITAHQTLIVLTIQIRPAHLHGHFPYRVTGVEQIARIGIADQEDVLDTQ